jgi:hypothetical protein
VDGSDTAALEAEKEEQRTAWRRWLVFALLGYMQLVCFFQYAVLVLPLQGLTAVGPTRAMLLLPT